MLSDANRLEVECEFLGFVIRKGNSSSFRSKGIFLDIAVKISCFFYHKTVEKCGFGMILLKMWHFAPVLK